MSMKIMIKLEDYLDNEMITQEQFKILSDAINNKKNILIFAYTGLGRTTLLKAIIQRIIDLGEKDQLVTLQDVGELLQSAGTGERIIVDDLWAQSTPEAADVLKSVSTNKKGVIISLNATSLNNAIEKIQQYSLNHGIDISRETLTESFDLAVYFKSDYPRSYARKIEIVTCFNSKLSGD